MKAKPLVVDVGVDIAALGDVLEVAQQHVVDHLTESVRECVEFFKTEHMFVDYVGPRTECPDFLQF